MARCTLLPLLLLAGCPGGGEKPEPGPGSGGDSASAGDDCDGDPVLYYQDLDGDGYGSTYLHHFDCDDDTTGWTLTPGDCDDSRASCAPGLDERCDVLDNDCDGEIDEDFEVGAIYPDGDGDGFGDPTAETWGCLEADGYVEDNTDCDPGEADSWPGAPELCDQQDNDCDSEVDEDLPTTTFYADQDGDGHGDSRITEDLCERLDGWAEDTTDCGIYDEHINIEHEENCVNGRDDDCDGLLDCEDDACSAERTCGELACADGLDDDSDGATDCSDDECWGDSACPTIVVSWVTSVAAAEGEQRNGIRKRWDTCDEDDPWHSVQWVTAASWSADEVVGSARVYPPDASVGLACAWGAPRAHAEVKVVRYDHLTSGVEWSARRSSSESSREGFWVSGACGLSGSGFLPVAAALNPMTSAWYNFGDVSTSEYWNDDASMSSACRSTSGESWDTDWYWVGTERWEDAVGSGENHVVTSAAYAPL